jgi:hypothetical protein
MLILTTTMTMMLTVGHRWYRCRCRCRCRYHGRRVPGSPDPGCLREKTMPLTRLIEYRVEDGAAVQGRTMWITAPVTIARGTRTAVTPRKGHVSLQFYFHIETLHRISSK